MTISRCFCGWSQVNYEGENCPKCGDNFKLIKEFWSEYLETSFKLDHFPPNEKDLVAIRKAFHRWLKFQKNVTAGFDICQHCLEDRPCTRSLIGFDPFITPRLNFVTLCGNCITDLSPQDHNDLILVL